MKILIKVTKEVLKRSAMCGGDAVYIRNNCAIALAVIEIFPTAEVFERCICLSPLAAKLYEDNLLSMHIHPNIITLPHEATNFIKAFDRAAPYERRNMNEFSFEVEVPQTIIDSIGIDQAYKILSESKTLELVTI